MTVFNAFFKVAKKYIGNFIMYTCIFLGVTYVMTNMQEKNPIESYSATECKVAIFNHSDDALAGYLVDYVDEHHDIVDIDEDLQSIRDEMYIRRVHYVITIPENFAETLELEVYKMPGSFASMFLDMSLNSFISTYSGYIAGGMEPADAYTNTVETVNKECSVTLNSESKATTYTDEHYFFNFMPYVLLCVICLGVAPILITFNKTEVKNRMLCSGISLSKRNLQLAMGCMIYTIAVVAVYVIVAAVMFGNVILTTEGVLRVLNTLTYAMVCISLTFLLSTLTQKNNVVNMFVNAVGLGTSFLCGVFVPRELLGKGVASIGRFFPAYWYVNVEEAVSSLSSSVTNDIILGYAVQLLFAVAFMTLALVIGNRRKTR